MGTPFVDAWKLVLAVEILNTLALNVKQTPSGERVAVAAAGY